MALIVILDTDLILSSIKFKVDIFSELDRILDEKYEVCVVEATVDELKGRISNGLISKFLERVTIIISETGEGDADIEKAGYADKAILEIVRPGVIVATQDRELKEKLKKRKIGVITIRQKKHLVLENVL